MINMHELSEIVNNKNTRDHIENCTIEELSELTKAITKSKRGKLDIENMTEELGHVMLMCGALAKNYDIQPKSINLEAQNAVDRMLKAQENK